MAFEAYRSAQKAPPRRGRRLVYGLSIAFHAALIAAGVAYSFWHVEELSPPSVHVTFMSGTAMAPPPPPPPAGGGAAKKKVAIKPKQAPILPRKPTEILQPAEQPKAIQEPQNDPKVDDEDDEPGEKAGVRGGTIGGTPGGTIGGTIGGTPGGTIDGTIGGTPGSGGTPKFLPPNLGALQKASGDDPPFPVALRSRGGEYVVIANICVTRTGAVDKVTILKKADPLLDAGVIATVKTWRFRPLMSGSLLVPFCYHGTFQFKRQ